MHDGRTIVLPHCDACPPVNGWPMKNLIMGQCPDCGASNADRAFREIKAREAIAGTREGA